MITATLEVERGIENLWRYGPGPGFKDYPNYGEYLPVNYFRAFINGFPHLWSPKKYWYVENVPWESFLPLVQAFNGKRRSLIKSVYMVLDESMSAWRPKTSQFGGLPNLTYEARKPKPLGTMFKNGVEATTGIVVYQDIVETKEVQREKKYNGDVSSLPLGEPILQHVGEVLRQCEGAKLASGGWVGGDAWFGSIPAVVELKKKFNIFSTFIFKQNIQYCPKQVLHRVLSVRHPRYPAGHHVVMKATISGVELFILAYAYSNQGITYMVSSCGTTIAHEKAYRGNFTDEYGNVTFKELPRPCVAHFLYELLPLIDNHNKDRQSLLALEDCWPTKNPWFRLVTTLVGMSVVDVHRWDRNRRSGGRAMMDMDIDEQSPMFLTVRAVANLIARGLRHPDMMFRTNKRFYHPSRGVNDALGSALIRIRVNGEKHRRIGKRYRDYQRSCFVCRQYSSKQSNTSWWCKFCNMPLCSVDRGRGLSCEKAHITALHGPMVCKGPSVKRTFVLARKHKQYLRDEGESVEGENEFSNDDEDYFDADEEDEDEGGEEEGDEDEGNKNEHEQESESDGEESSVSTMSTTELAMYNAAKKRQQLEATKNQGGSTGKRRRVVSRPATRQTSAPRRSQRVK